MEHTEERKKSCGGRRSMTTNHIDVDASPHAVYDVLLDAHAYADWVIGSKRVRYVDPEWPAPGARFHHTVGAPGVDIKDSSKLLELDADHRVVLEVRFRPLGTAIVVMDLEPLDDGSRTHITMTENPKSGPVHRLPAFVIAVITSIRNAFSLRRLARLAEQRAQKPTAR
jgi:uncharacterized protein YndB with AHSA1/START domain